MKSLLPKVLSALLLIFGPWAARPVAAEPGTEIIDLASSLEPLRASFNQHKGDPRFIALLSPT